MHAATLTSPRLKRVQRLLANGRPHSTRDIARRAHVLAISACVAELRQNGAEISCQREKVGEKWVFFYTMTKGPTNE
jgi:biotin operon repressor